MPRKSTLVIAGLAVLVAICGLCWGFSAYPQSPDRIAGPIEKSPAISLEGNRRIIFQPENDQGPVEDSLKLENISLMFKLTEIQQAELTALLEEQQNRKSS